MKLKRKQKLRKRKQKHVETLVEGILAEGKGGVVAPPLVLHAALVVSAVRLRWFLGQERIGQKARTRVFLDYGPVHLQYPLSTVFDGVRWTKEGKDDMDLMGL